MATTNGLTHGEIFDRAEVQAKRSVVPVFVLEECGDPYSRHWQVTEYTRFGWVYRGDLPHLRRGSLIRHLRRLYPSCKVYSVR